MNQNKAGQQGGRRDRLLEERSHDAYREERKHHDPSVCPDCDATFRDGRWSWGAGPVDAPRVVCPACRRIQSDDPAGFVNIRGPFARQHREEIQALLGHVEERERADRPLNRIMDTRSEGDDLVVRTTDGHLARALGSALKSAYQGQLDIDYAEDVARITWAR